MTLIIIIITLLVIFITIIVNIMMYIIFIIELCIKIKDFNKLFNFLIEYIKIFFILIIIPMILLYNSINLITDH